ncbi:coiled-coil domain-containing protein [Helicobacter suis]|uniref:mobilization protein n=1 Tax=Helicobacter suis TaxID=104628 RepID=UPI001F48F015|nr:mobilization protein [Helicobacter suis]
MGNLASINFKKSISIQVVHNDRTLPPTYLLDKSLGLGFECNRNAKEARALKAQMIDQAITNYTKRTKKKFQAKSYEWSAVVNLKEDSTMQDLENLADHFKAKYGFQCYQIAIHRDEGHTDEYGTTHINHHAHLEFVTLDELTGKSLFRSDLRTSKAFRQFQDEVATILQMERGTDKRISKTKRIEPRAYAQQAEKAKEERKSLKEQFNKWAYAKIDEVDSLKAQLQRLQLELQELEAQYKKEKEIREKLEVELQVTKEASAKQHEADIQAMQDAVYIAQQNHKVLSISLKKQGELEAELQAKDQVIQKLEQDNKDLRTEQMTLKSAYENLRTEVSNERFDTEQLVNTWSFELSDKDQKIYELEQEIQDLKAKLQQSQAQNQTHQLQQPKSNAHFQNPQWEDYYQPKKGRGRH